MTIVTKQYRVGALREHSCKEASGKAVFLREREILRYAGCRTEEEELVRLMRTCLQEAEDAGVLNGQLCYAELPLVSDVVTSNKGSDVKSEAVAGRARERTESLTYGNESVCCFDCFSVRSEQLVENLRGCSRVLLLAATAGVGIDRLIGKYGRIAPSKALMFQAIGTELVEAVCDAFGKEYEAEHNCVLRPRFSPGYGDLALETQKDIFAVLEPARKIGLTLNDSLLMSPSKSVTAFAGITDCDERCRAQDLSECEQKKAQNKCGSCDKKDCVYRGEEDGF